MLTPETWDDFATPVETSNGVWGGCWCMGFHPEGVGAGHTREGNREAKRRHVTRGTVRQVLVYDGDRCVGWCQFGSPPELPNINNRRTYDQGAGDPPDWRIGCIFTNAKDRGKGVAAPWSTPSLMPRPPATWLSAGPVPAIRSTSSSRRRSRPASRCGHPRQLASAARGQPQPYGQHHTTALKTRAGNGLNPAMTEPRQPHRFLADSTAAWTRVAASRQQSCHAGD